MKKDITEQALRIVRAKKKKNQDLFNEKISVLEKDKEFIKIKKEYIIGNLHQTVLNGITLNLRDNEFVAILGPSGSGKTTLLNIIGGLDHYDSGDLIINGISTKKYKFYEKIG